VVCVVGLTPAAREKTVHNFNVKYRSAEGLARQPHRS
jgi:hypothetical protein